MILPQSAHLPQPVQTQMAHLPGRRVNVVISGLSQPDQDGWQVCVGLEYRSPVARGGLVAFLVDGDGGARLPLAGNALVSYADVKNLYEQVVGLWVPLPHLIGDPIWAGYRLEGQSP